MIEQLVKQLQKSKNPVIFSHIRPDGDAIGSQVAMSLWFKNQGIEAVAVNEDDVPPNMTWLSDLFPIQKPTQDILDQADAFIFVDGSAAYRFGDWGVKANEMESVPSYVIDHHPDTSDEFDLAYAVVSASSTCELLYRVFEATDLNLIDNDAARAMYTGLVTDTGSFRFDSVSAEVHDIVADLLRRGNFRPNVVHEELYDRRTQKQLHLLGEVLKSIELFNDGKIAAMRITQKMLDDHNSAYSDTDGFIAYPLSLNGVDSAFIASEKEGKIKLSLRSKRLIKANEWAKAFGGGGHARAAGCWHDSDDMDEAIEAVVGKGIELMEE